MKYLHLFLLFLSACSSYAPKNSERYLASKKLIISEVIELTLSQPLVVANGLNRVQLSIKAKDENGNPVSLKPSEVEIVTSSQAKLGEIVSQGEGLLISIAPKTKSPSLKIFVTTKNSQSPIIVLKTTLEPIKDKLAPLPFGPSNNSTVNGIDVTRQDNFPVGQYEGFIVSNRGKNAIVNAEDSNREFAFDFEEQARQNLSMLVQDAPNGTTSHGMLSHFILFPRVILPYAEVQSNEDVLVTLTNGEEVRFNKQGEIVDGVFEEGPVDTGPDRFTRTYANLKYQGKGILLRANARGQMPQQGQFEATKIDMQYGIKYSSDVLIINGTTGERCRRPKKDFWSDADVTPIQFKFPTDAEFDAYLRANCKFGIPNLSVNTNFEIEDKEAQQIFEIKRNLFQEKLNENAQVDSKVAAETSAIRPKLLSDFSWVSSGIESQIKEDCLKKSLSLSTLEFKFNNAAQLMKPSLIISCSSIKNDLEIIARDEIKNLISPLSEDFSWVNLSKGQNFGASCQKEFFNRYNNLNLKNAHNIYSQSLIESCIEIEKSMPFKNWLSTQAVAVEERLFLSVRDIVTASSEVTAQKCVEQYPMNSALNRLRYKKQREACLIDEWSALEAKAVASALKDPLAQKVGINAANLILRLDKDRRVNQLKLIKKYFQQ